MRKFSEFVSQNYANVKHMLSDFHLTALLGMMAMRQEQRLESLPVAGGP